MKQSTAIAAALRQELAVGDSRATIEAALDKVGATYSYDRFRNRYQAKVNVKGGNYHAITIHVNLDSDGKFASFDVRDSYTMP